MPELKYQRVIEQPELEYQTKGSAAFDIRGYFPDEFKELLEDGKMWLEKGTSLILRTGLKFNIPAGHVLQIYGRSGIGFKNDVALVNCVGIIDSDYTQEVMIKLIAHTEDFLIVDGMRVAQGILQELEDVVLVPVENVEETNRGGFGSTGVK